MDGDSQAPGSSIDRDLDDLPRERLIDEARRLREAIRVHRDSSEHELCWHHPALWRLLPEKTDPLPTVPDWPEFLEGCLHYRRSLDAQLPEAPRSDRPHDADRTEIQSPDAPTVAGLEALLQAFNRHDLDAIMRFFAEDCVLEMPRGRSPWGERHVGKHEVRKGLAGRFAGTPDVHYERDRHFVSGSIGVSQWTLTGTTTEGKRLEVRGLDVLDFRDGRVVRKDSYWKIVD